MMFKNYFILIVITCLFFTFSCNNSTSTTLTKEVEPVKAELNTDELYEQLKGVWYAVNYPLEGKPYKPTQFYKVSFERKSIGIKLSVNSCGGGYTIIKTGVIEFTGTTFCTEACCDNKESMALSNLFKGKLNYTISQNTLTITTPSGDIKLQKNIETIQGSEWAAVSYADRKENVSIKFKEPYVLAFQKEGVQLRLNANNCTTTCTYLDKENAFELPSNSMGCTRMCCDNEDAILLMNSLQGKITYQKDGNNLRLKTFNKEIIFSPFVNSSKD